MQYGKYTFQCRFEHEAVLPSYKGSTFRGVFGIALKKVVCALKRQACETCLLRTRCLYARVFETPIALQMPEGSRISTPPHPFVVEPPETHRREFAPGDTLACDFLLFGEVNRSLPYFVFAFEQMGRIGIGKRINGRRGRFVLDEVRAGDEVLYDVGGETLSRFEAKDLLLVERPTAPESGVSRLRVDLKTPLRIKYDNRLKADLPFHVLVRAMLRRISSLMSVYGTGEPDLDYRGMVERAGAVRTVENRLRWFDWERYSNRQERKMLMGGIIGSVTYEGRLSEYLPLLDFCEKVHLGKNTSFGLGKIKAREVR